MINDSLVDIKSELSIHDIEADDKLNKHIDNYKK